MCKLHCNFPVLQPFAAQPLLWLERGKENFRGAAAPKTLWLPESLVFTFQNLKNSGGIHTALIPSGVLEDLKAQKCSWPSRGRRAQPPSQRCRLSIPETCLDFLLMPTYGIYKEFLDIMQGRCNWCFPTQGSKCVGVRALFLKGLLEC